MPKYLEHHDFVPKQNPTGIQQASKTINETEDFVSKINSLAGNVLKIMETINHFKKKEGGNEGVKSESAYNDGLVMGRNEALSLAPTSSPAPVPVPQIIYKDVEISINRESLEQNLIQMLESMNPEMTLKAILEEKIKPLKDKNMLGEVLDSYLIQFVEKKQK
jgi:hypothetical protein